MPLHAAVQRVVDSVGVPTSILASEKNLVIVDAMMGNYLEHDWCDDITVPSAPGASAGQPLFPAGALLGWLPSSGARTFPHAQTANRAAPGYEASTSRLVRTWFSVATLAQRGLGGLAIIPASNDSMACVLAKDVDISDQVTAGQNIIVPVIWQGIFTPRGIVEDAEAFAVAAWPTAVGTCDRLEIVAKPNWTHG